MDDIGTRDGTNEVHLFASSLFTSHTSKDIFLTLLRDGMTMDYQQRGIRLPHNYGSGECLRWLAAIIEQQGRCDNRHGAVE